MELFFVGPLMMIANSSRELMIWEEMGAVEEQQMVKPVCHDLIA